MPRGCSKNRISPALHAGCSFQCVYDTCSSWQDKSSSFVSLLHSLFCSPNVFGLYIHFFFKLGITFLSFWVSSGVDLGVLAWNSALHVFLFLFFFVKPESNYGVLLCQLTRFWLVQGWHLSAGTEHYYRLDTYLWQSRMEDAAYKSCKNIYDMLSAAAKPSNALTDLLVFFFADQWSEVTQLRLLQNNWRLRLAKTTTNMPSYTTMETHPEWSDEDSTDTGGPGSFKTGISL